MNSGIATFIIFISLCVIALVLSRYLHQRRSKLIDSILRDAPQKYLSRLDKILATGERVIGKTAEVVKSSYSLNPEKTQLTCDFTNVCRSSSGVWFIHEFSLIVSRDEVVLEKAGLSNDAYVKSLFRDDYELYKKYFGEPSLI